MSNNQNMHKAKVAKNDEFYTLYTDVEKELSLYSQYLKEKVIYCNCDNPYVSNFFRYFANNFKALGIKKVIATCYNNGKGAFKAILEHQVEDVEKWLNNGNVTLLDGNGDFASPECVKFIDEADIVVTNPPFSLFREFVALLMEHKKQFLIIGNMNAITYKEIFPLIKENKLWLGCTSPKEFVQPDGTTKKFGNICWFTNLPVEKRDKCLDLFEEYSPDKYPMYDNYLAINVDRVSDIPCNEWFIMTVGEDRYNKLKATYGDDCVLIDGDDVKKQYRIKVRNIVMGVPITFLYKYNPNQFEIVSFRKGDNGEDLIFSKKKENEFNRTFESLYDIDSRSDQEQVRIDKWEAYIRENNNKKGLAGTFIDEPVDCFHVLLTNGVNKLKVDTKNIFKRLLVRHKNQNKP